MLDCYATPAWALSSSSRSFASGPLRLWDRCEDIGGGVGESAERRTAFSNLVPLKNYQKDVHVLFSLRTKACTSLRQNKLMISNCLSGRGVFPDPLPIGYRREIAVLSLQILTPGIGEQGERSWMEWSGDLRRASLDNLKTALER